MKDRIFLVRGGGGVVFYIFPEKEIHQKLLCVKLLCSCKLSKTDIDTFKERSTLLPPGGQPPPPQPPPPPPLQPLPQHPSLIITLPTQGWWTCEHDQHDEHEPPPPLPHPQSPTPAPTPTPLVDYYPAYVGY